MGWVAWPQVPPAPYGMGPTLAAEVTELTAACCQQKQPTTNHPNHQPHHRGGRGGPASLAEPITPGGEGGACQPRIIYIYIYIYLYYMIFVYPPTFVGVYDKKELRA